MYIAQHAEHRQAILKDLGYDINFGHIFRNFERKSMVSGLSARPDILG